MILTMINSTCSIYNLNMQHIQFIATRRRQCDGWTTLNIEARALLSENFILWMFVIFYLLLKGPFYTAGQLYPAVSFLLFVVYLLSLLYLALKNVFIFLINGFSFLIFLALEVYSFILYFH